MIDDPTSICPTPGPGQRVREGGNSWEEAQEEDAGDGDETCGPIDATAKPDLETPCVISFYEDDD
jgi:hypothetical protein